MSNKQNTNTQKAKGSSPKATGNASSTKSKKVQRAPPRPQKSSVAFVAKTNSQTSRGSAPVLMRTGLKSELLFTVPASKDSALFEVVKRIRINPLSRETFKWLPAIAQNFESFKFHFLRIRYENRCSTSQNGSIILSPSYDAADSNAQTATEALLYENKGTKDFSVWKNESLVLSVPAMNRLYKHHTCMSDERFATTKQDLKTIDPAQVFIAIDTVSTTVPPGKIFLDYDCEFFEPHAPTEPINQGGAVFSYAAAITPNSTLPFSSDLATYLQESSPLFETQAELFLKNEVAYPSAVIGKLLKDASIYLDLEMNGTVLNNIGGTALYRSLNPLSAAGSAGDVVIGLVRDYITNSGQTKQSRSYKLPDGMAGEYIKMATTTATTLTSALLNVGGTTVF